MMMLDDLTVQHQRGREVGLLDVLCYPGGAAPTTSLPAQIFCSDVLRLAAQTNPDGRCSRSLLPDRRVRSKK